MQVPSAHGGTGNRDFVIEMAQQLASPLLDSLKRAQIRHAGPVGCARTLSEVIFIHRIYI